MNRINQNFQEPTFKQQLYFEMTSWVGRHFRKHKSKITQTNLPLLLDIGVGANYTDGWTHVDFYNIRFKFWKKHTMHRKPEIETDLRFPLNCPSDVVDGIYSGHTLEHLYPNHAYQLLREMNRVLKSECWLRINVPDLQIAVDHYTGKINIPNFKYKAEAIGDLTQNWGHHSVWDEELLTLALQLTGFKNIRKVEFGKEGTDKRLIKEEEIRRLETLVIEAQKP